MFRKAFCTLLVLVLTACSTSPQVVEVTREVPREVTQLVEVTRIVEVTREVTVLPPTPEPTATAAASESQFSRNCLGKFESGGIEINILRMVIGEKTAVSQDFSAISAFDNANVVGMIIMRVTNTSDKTLRVYPDQAQLVMGNEQVELRDYLLAGIRGMDNIGGDIFAGVSKVGGFWFGVRQTPLDQVAVVRYIISGPTDDNFNQAGGDFDFELDMSGRDFAPLPDNITSTCQ